MTAKKDPVYDIIKIINVRAIKSNYITAETIWCMCENSPLHYLEELIELDSANGDKSSKGEIKQRQRLEDTRKEIKRR